MTHRSESQDDMHRSTADYLLWKINPIGVKKRGRGGGKSKGMGVKGHLFLMNYKAM